MRGYYLKRYSYVEFEKEDKIGGSTMTDADRKLLTEFLGECWHEFSPRGITPAADRCVSCGKLRIQCIPDVRRSFTTWQDFGDVKEKLVEKGLWPEFRIHCINIYHYTLHDDGRWELWLLDPARLQDLANFLRRRK